MNFIPSTTEAFTVNAGTTYTVTTSPWAPSGDVIVYGNLDISAGVTVKLSAGARIQIAKNGRFRALGTSTSPIIFTAASATHWLGIEVLGDPNNHKQPDFDSYNYNYNVNGENKGTPIMWYCTVEKCNFGIVAGDIQPGPSVDLLTSGKGGAILNLNYCTFQYIDYAGVMLTPFSATNVEPNASDISNCNIYDDYEKDGFIGMGFYGIFMGLVDNNTVKCRIYTYLTNVGGRATFGIYVNNSAITLQNNRIEGFTYGIQFESNNNSFSRSIIQNAFTNDWWDIVAEDSKNVHVSGNTSTKDMGDRDGIPNYVVFARVDGDGWYISYNDASLLNYIRGYSFSNTGIVNTNPNTSTGKLYDFNTFNTYDEGIASYDNNFGAHFSCNTFINTIHDVQVISGGVAMYQGSAKQGEFNTWHTYTTCSRNGHWFQSPNATPTYYYYLSSGEPVCTNVTLYQYASNDKKCSASGYIISYNPYPGNHYYIGKMDAVMAELAQLPSSPSSMTQDQLSDYVNLSHSRDIYLNAIVQNYTDSSLFDSAFYILAHYPCAEASLKKLDLNLTLGNYSALPAFEDSAALAFAGDSAENIYYDSLFSAQIPVYYPLSVQLIQNGFSDSILDALHNDLAILSSHGGYLGGVATNIIDAQIDSSYKAYSPRPSGWRPASGDSMVIVYGGGGSLPLGLNNPGNKEVTLYPNPANNTLFISGLASATSVHYSIYSLIGEVMATGIAHKDGENYKLDMHKLSQGIYFLYLKSGSDVKHYKFIKI